MYQIFVAEDELLIRQSIRRTIETMKGPYALCGEAADGEIALSMMQDLMPDILLTDIRMPFLDGFGLIRNVRERMPWLKIVIISGYGDFDLAQKAISLGVDEYLLKPVRPAELTAAIEKMAAQLEKSKEEVRLSGHQEVQWQDALRRQFTQQLLYGGENTESLLENARQLGLDIVKPRFLVSVHYLDTQDLDHALVQNVMRRVTEGTPRTLYCFHSENQFSLLVSGQDDEAVSDRTYQLIQILRHEFREVCPDFKNSRVLQPFFGRPPYADGLFQEFAGAAFCQILHSSSSPVAVFLFTKKRVSKIPTTTVSSTNITPISNRPFA